MSLGLFLAMALAQSAQKPPKPARHPDAAWESALECLQDPNRCHDAIGYFREAARGYEWLRSVNGDDPYCLRSAGYSYQYAGDLPQAIAAYRRGLTLDPADVKLRSAIANAREQVQYSRDLARILQPERESWPAWLSLRDLGLEAFGLYFAACLAATRWLMTRHRRWLIVGGAFLALAALPAIGSLIEWQQGRRDAAEPIVVVARDVPLRLGNGPDYPPKLEMPPGCEVRQLFERAGWLQVQTGGGAVGWLPADAVVGR